jgi:MoaA/NifB/PqqE/SkfB family radical SAM enzyme
MSVESNENSTSIAAPTGNLRSMPILLLSVHENCNCRCVMCDIWKRPAGAEIDLNGLARHRDSLRSLGVRQVVLTGGEPLLHSRFVELCQFLRECRVQITLLTTGLLLTKRASSVAEWVDQIIISLDGPEKQHDAIRRVKNGFDLTRKGIAALRKSRPDILIQARSTVQRANFLFLRETVAAAKSLQFDSISFLAIDVSSQAFNRELVWPREQQDELALRRAEICALEGEIESLEKEFSDDFSSGFIVESPERLRRIARRFREHLGELPPEAPICNAPWFSAVLEVDGSVRPCFFHRTIGNVKHARLEEVVNSADATQFRRTLDIAQNPICQRCVCSLNYRDTP